MLLYPLLRFLLHLFVATFTHPIRARAILALTIAALLAVGFWPGRAEAKFRAVGCACFLYALPLYAYELTRRLRKRGRP